MLLEEYKIDTSRNLPNMAFQEVHEPRCLQSEGRVHRMIMREAHISQVSRNMVSIYKSFDEKCPTWALVFKYLVLSWWCQLGRLWNF